MTEGKKFLEKKVMGQGLVFVLGDGERIVFNPATVSDEVKAMALLHGFSQKIGDAAAGFSKGKDFKGAKAAMEEVVDSLIAGQWNRSGGGIGGVIVEDLSKAIARLRNVPVEKARDAVDRATAEQRKEWAKNAKVAAIMAELKAERLRAGAKDEDAPDDLPVFGDEEG